MEGEQSRVAPNSGRADVEAMSIQYKAENRMGCVRSHQPHHTAQGHGDSSIGTNGTIWDPGQANCHEAETTSRSPGRAHCQCPRN